MPVPVALTASDLPYAGFWLPPRLDQGCDSMALCACTFLLYALLRLWVLNMPRTRMDYFIHSGSFLLCHAHLYFSYANEHVLTVQTFTGYRRGNSTLLHLY
jgi:hypothetical protein